MKTKVASGTWKVQEQCLGGHQHLAGQWTPSNDLKQERKKEKKMYCCLRPLDKPNTDFLQEMKTTTRSIRSSISSSLGVRQILRTFKVDLLKTVQYVNQEPMNNAFFISVKTCKSLWSLQMLTSNITKLCGVLTAETAPRDCFWTQFSL